MNWKVKCNWGSGDTLSHSLGSLDDQGAKLLENVQYVKSLELNIL